MEFEDKCSRSNIPILSHGNLHEGNTPYKKYSIYIYIYIYIVINLCVYL